VTEIIKDMAVEFEKANYVGNKRRLAKYIVGKFPQDAKTLYDPMAGCSAVLIEAAKRGYRVKGNDLSIVPYWYSKGIFEGALLTEADIDKLINAPAHEGWLTTEWKGIYPRPPAIRRFLDGMAKKARDWQGPKGLAARAIVSRVLQTMYADSGSGFSTQRYESLDTVRRVVKHAAKEINGFTAEVAGKGTVTNDNAKSMRIPQADVIYFDPPFFKRDKGYVHYFETYRVMNSILLGKQWKEDNLKPEDIPPVLEKLCRSCRHIYISTSSNEVVPYAKELARLKRSMKRYRVGYKQVSGFGSRDENQREHLYVAKAEAGIIHPPEDKIYRYAVHEHFRGKSMHADLCIESADKESLIGWTLNTVIADAIEEPVTLLSQARALDVGYSRIDWETGEFGKRPKEGASEPVNVEILSEPKEPEPRRWLDFEGVIEPGNVGATNNYPGVLHIVDKGICEYGAQKKDFREYFPHSDRKEGGLHYRIIFKHLRLPGRDGQDARDVWFLIKPDNQTPYVISKGAAEEGWIPPAGISCLPKSLRSAVPGEFQYWEKEDAGERQKTRDALVESLHAGEVDLPGLGKTFLDEFLKHRFVPFNQWGGSSRYAATLAGRLPEHRKYIEPFCGSAAVFFAKDRVEEEILADTDPEVVFALKYIKHLTPERLEELKRFTWTVSRTGFKRAKECTPTSRAERFWKFVYGRMCSWGGKSDQSGYSTVSEGKTYKLEDFMPFKEKLNNARIVRQDWKETLKNSDGEGALFFLDPPYIEEWAQGEGIAPEDIAELAGKLKGEFVIAYTDSARARRALSKVGKLFKMKIPEARHGGLWQKRNRLFAASFDIKKSIPEPEEIEVESASAV